jgi:hypothetical protein
LFAEHRQHCQTLVDNQFEVVDFVLLGFAQGDAFEFSERFFHEYFLCNNYLKDWGFSVGIGLRRLSGAFVFVLTETPLSPIPQSVH